MIKKILKIALIVFALAALAALDFWLIWKKGWPWWFGGAMYLGVIGIFVGLLFLRKYFLRRKEKKFVQRVVQLDESAIKGAPIHERQQLMDLQEHWKESLELLRRSSLKRYGNPLYALPWYVVIGESGSGKTTAIRNSRLESPVAYPDRAATISATANCDWWFFESSIVLDTAGRYTIPIDEVPDKEEWERFLALLAKYRRREPINGIIATIPANKLLLTDRTVLREDGQNIRKRIDQLMRVVGASFPVYILVTKMDMVYGFAETFADLAEEDANQAMGYMNREKKVHWDKFLEDAFESVSDHIRDASVTKIRSSGLPGPGTIVFHNEFCRLKTGLLEFIKAVFGDNPYQETPLLRGLFFSSGRQDGTPASEFLDTAGFVPDKPQNAAASTRGIFLKDIFARILPGDRSLYTYTRDFIRWRRLTQGLGFSSWLLLWAALCGLLAFSFAHNLKTLVNFTDVFDKLPAVTGDVTQKLMILEKFRLEIEELEGSNAHWFLPTFGFTESKEAERRAKAYYVTSVNKGFLWNFDKTASGRKDKAIEEADPDTVAIFANYIVTRLQLLNAALDKGKIPDSENFSNAAAEVINIEYPSIPPEISLVFGNIYEDYLRWHNNRAELLRSRELVQAALARIVTVHGNLEWLVHKSIPNVANVRLENFWGSAEVGEHDDTVFVPGAYTKEGQKHIEDFIENINEALAGKDIVQKKVPPFWKWYQEEYYKAWFSFAENFHKGTEGYQTETAIHNLASIMTTDHNPYWKLLVRLSAESIQSDKDSKPPAWVDLPKELLEIAKLSSADQKDSKKSESIKSKIEKELKKTGTSVEQKALKLDPARKAVIEQRPSRAKVFAEYDKALGQMAPLAASGDTALRMISDLFAGQAALAEDKSPFNIAYTQYLSLKNMMKEDGYGNADFIWSVFGGPLNFLVDFGTRKTSCLLQGKWEGDVISKAESIPREKLLKSLFDKTEGLVVQFRDGPAKPFLVSGKTGYNSRKAYEKTIFEHSIPFRPEFLKFLNAGAMAPVEFQSDYSVSIETVPIEVNSDATVKPLGNVLSLQCSDGDAILKNYNYPDSKSFRWSPEKCGNTVLKIMFPGFTITKIYKGKTAFASFLSDFSSGSKTYKAGDLPEHKTNLSKSGVGWIKVRYKIDNAQPVIATLKKSSKKAPSVITDCTLK